MPATKWHILLSTCCLLLFVISNSIAQVSQPALFTPLYQGVVFTPSPSNYEGSVFFAGDKFSDGSICYRGYCYEDVKLNFDALEAKFVVSHPEMMYPVYLENSWIEEVKIGSAQFRKVSVPELNNTFFAEELIAKDSTALYARHRRKIRKEAERNMLRFIVSREDQYFLKWQGQILEMDHKRDFYRLNSGFKSELKSHYREQNLNWRRDPRKAFQSLTLKLAELSKDAN